MKKLPERKSIDGNIDVLAPPLLPAPEKLLRAKTDVQRQLLTRHDKRGPCDF